MPELVASILLSVVVFTAVCTAGFLCVSLFRCLSAMTELCHTATAWLEADFEEDENDER